jgi:hypothetical protein
MRSNRQSGQATVELVALLPLLAIVLALAWQLVVAGHATWAATAAARAAARAEAVGEDPGRAARRHLPRGLERGMRVRARAGTVELSLAIPSVLPGLRLGRVHTEARFESQAPR